jgi:hypothetical protein
MPTLSPFQFTDLLGHQLLWRCNTPFATPPEYLDPFDRAGEASFNHMGIQSMAFPWLERT